MQHQQQQVGGGGGYSGGAAAEMLISDEDQKLGDLGIAEAASPISSRPPASTTIGNNTFEEMIQATAEAGGSSGNRWPRQETLALLQIRSEMDAAFRDATLKGPLWEQVSRKLGDLGYKRSGKKCKEKFENVHKYYKRTKEGRGGRQDGKSYKFFTQLEALHHNTATAVQVPPRTTAVATVPLSLPPPSFPPPVSVSLPPPPHDHISTGPSNMFGNVGVNFSSDSSSSSDGEDEDEDEEMEMESTGDATNRKRKRSGGGGEHSDERMMDFFEGLLKQVMQKQEAMQQKFLEAIEKREQDRMIREEAWKRQDMARIAREHDLMAQERAISASRDAAIVAFLEKITGQTIHLPTAAPQNPPPPPPTTTTTEPPHPPAPPSEKQTHPHQGNEAIEPQIKNTCSDMVAVMPEQQQIVPHQDSTVEMNSSRWPKTEVLALIQLRSGKETKYQESGPKGPLWEEISADMQRMGYNRNPKRCKEKWENINKYFKKVKESNKKRPEDAKTCPYFNELDAWYRKKQHGVAGSSNIAVAEDDVGMQTLAPNVASVDKAAAFSSTPFDQHRVQPHDIGGEKQPEDMLKKQLQRSHGDHLIDNCNNNVDHSNSDDLGHENEDEDNYEEVDENDEEMKMVYKIQFPRQNVRPASNGGGTTSSSFVAMVQ